MGHVRLDDITIGMALGHTPDEVAQLTSDNPGTPGDVHEGVELDPDGHVLGNDVHDENGITVIDSPLQAWCETKKHLCGFVKSSCAKIGTCKAVNAYSCFTAHAATTGTLLPYCFDTYGVCVKLRPAFVNDPEVRDPTECFVVRYKPKK